jgi:RNA polymerase sigma factor (sigma-70 family)
MDTIGDCLREHRFADLFLNHLGWEAAAGVMRTVSPQGRALEFHRIAESQGIQVLRCTADRHVLMNRVLLRRRQRTIARSVPEHILIFDCGEPRKQVWAWAVRLAAEGRPGHGVHSFFSASVRTGLLGRLDALRCGPDEGFADLRERVRQALDCPAERHLFARRARFAERSDLLAQECRRGGRAAFHEFVLLHLPLARTFSRHLVRRFALAADDAEQIAIIGMIKAAHRFDPELGFQFATLATRWMKQLGDRLGPETALPVRLPPALSRRYLKVARAVEQVLAAKGPSGLRTYLDKLQKSDPCLAAHLSTYLRINAIASLSDAREPEYHQARRIADDDDAPLDALLRAERIEMVHVALRRLPAREQAIIRFRYGIDGEPQTVDQVSAHLKLSIVRIYQLQRQAESWLRYWLQGWEVPAPGKANRLDPPSGIPAPNFVRICLHTMHQSP